MSTPAATYALEGVTHHGAQVSGVVVALAAAAAPAGRLSVSLVQHSKYAIGFRQLRAVVATTEIAAIPGSPGEAKRHEFTLACPAIPPAYDGTLVQVFYTVAVTTGGEGTDEPTAEAAVDVRLDVAEPLDVAPSPPDASLVLSLDSTPLAVTAGILAVAAALAAAAYGAGSWLVWPALAFVTVAALGVVAAVVQRRDQQRAGNVQVGFEPAPNGQLQCVVLVHPDAPPLEVAVDLLAEEVVFNDFRSQGDRKHVVHAAYEHTLALRHTEAGVYRGLLPDVLAAGAPLSMKNGLDSGISWHATAVVTGARGLRLERSVDMRVRRAVDGTDAAIADDVNALRAG